MRHVRVLTTACALAGTIALAVPAVSSAAFTRVSTQTNLLPTVAGSTVVWQAAGQGTPNDTGAYVWSVPASGASPARVLYQAPAIPDEGVVGADAAKTTPGQQPEGLEATTSFVLFQSQAGVFKTQQAGKGSPNFYTDFFASTTSLVAGPLAGPLAPVTLSADTGDPCPSGTVSELPLAATGSTLITIATCSTSAVSDPGRLLARQITNGQSTTPPVFLAGNGQSIGEIVANGTYLAGVQSTSGSSRNRVVVLNTTTGDVVTTLPLSPTNSSYDGLAVGTDGSVVATILKYANKKSSTSVVRYAAGSTKATTFPSSLGTILSSPVIAGSKVLFLRSVSGNDVQLISTTTSGTSVQGLGTFDAVSDVTGLSASSSYAAVVGTYQGKSGVWTRSLG